MEEALSINRRHFLKQTTCILAAFLMGSAKTPNIPIGVCSSIKNADLMQKAGVSFIEEGVSRILAPDQPDTVFRERLKAAKNCPLPILAANCFIPGSLKSIGPQANHHGVLTYAKTAFERAKQVGVTTIVFGSSSSRSIPKGFDKSKAELQFVALLAKMAPLAKKYGVIVAVEPLNKKECNFINTLKDGARLVEPVNHPSIRLLADIYHMLRMDEGPEQIRKFAHLLHHTHIAEKEKRTAPGVKGDDFTPYFKVLNKCGYSGRLSIECRWRDFENELPKAILYLTQQMKQGKTKNE